MRLILASNSPRRRELLSALNLPFEVVPSRFEEVEKEQGAAATCLHFAEGKAREVFSRYPGAAVLGADTVVSLGDEILGKPKNEQDAARMLRRLSGREHSVFTGVCLIYGDVCKKTVVETKVTFFSLSEETIAGYVASGLPMDKAGAYGIQDGFPLVKKFEGSYTNVIGLPMEEVERFLKEGHIC